jgi:Carbohydrate-binding module 48 (Isoamylase N-terminal domain)
MNTTLNPIERPARSLYSARKMAKPVNFFCDNPDAHSVSLLGDFNDWNPNSHAMRRNNLEPRQRARFSSSWRRLKPKSPFWRPYGDSNPGRRRERAVS